MSSNYIKWILIFAFLLFGLRSYAQQNEEVTLTSPPSIDRILQWEESFTYKVKYSFFNLGEIKVQVVRDTLDGMESWRLETIIISNSSVPFVGEEEVHYNSIFTTEAPMLKEHLFWRDKVLEEKFKDALYRFDYENNKIYAREEAESDTLKLKKNGGSGHLMFLIGRMFAGIEDEFSLPIYIELEKGKLQYHSTTETEMREYEPFDEPVKTFYSEGETDIEGPFGFKGSFKSWYMADTLRVPVEAHVRVWLGNAKIILTDYSKKLRK